MKKPDYLARSYVVRYRTLNGEKLYLTKDEDIIEEPQLGRVDTYYDIHTINYGRIIEIGEKYNEDHQSNPIISYEIAIMETEVYMRRTPNGAFIYFPDSKEEK